MAQSVLHTTRCNHCGETCAAAAIRAEDKFFCCEGCKMVYEIINNSGLCAYYDLNETPGAAQRIPVRTEKFAYLDDDTISNQIISFRNDRQVRVSFFLPQIHCSSCLYLLENIHRFDRGIISCRINFPTKKADIVFDPSQTSLRKVAEILTSIGYEPYISLKDINSPRPRVSKSLVIQLGVAGFCFSNIMLMSFPEYLGVDQTEESIRSVFRWANFFLALPVFFYSAFPFFESSWKSLKHRFLNIDAPVALAIFITFVRSIWEVLSGEGGGYFDSMSGIVFFMLAGRVLQDKTHKQLSFDRDFTSYFPVAVSVLKNGKETPTMLPDIKVNDTLLIHNGELVPADGILIKGKALIDYSFVTGESLPESREIGELLYAGGKQVGAPVEVMVIKEVNNSYLTGLWNNGKTAREEKNKSFVHRVSKYFTLVVFTIALLTGLYWWQHDPSRIWPAVTAIFIIACPCALLLSHSFTNGHILRILSSNRLFLRDAQVIEDITRVNHIVFDKTGTLTSASEQEVHYEGTPLTNEQKKQVAALASCSSHPLSKAITRWLGQTDQSSVQGFKETPGVGIEGFVDDLWIRIGMMDNRDSKDTSTAAGVWLENRPAGRFVFSNQYRSFVPKLLNTLQQHYRISVISGDNEAERANLENMLGKNATILFRQQPEDKLQYIARLQEKGDRVMMIGDGLNDAGALQKSDTGIAVSEHSNTFTPSSDGIAEAEQLRWLPQMIGLCHINRRIIIGSFVYSIIYNVVGLYFAVQGTLSPLIAAILMPSSSLGIILLTYGASKMAARRLQLKD